MKKTVFISGSPSSMDMVYSFGLVILAAGASSRMGQPKLLLPWGNTSVLGRLLRQWQGQQPAQIGIVLAPGNEMLKGECCRLGLGAEHQIFNPHPEEGMFSSVQAAARWPKWDASITHWVLSLGDQPQVRSETYGEVLGLSREHPEAICQPGRHGRPRHPVLLPRSLFEALAGSTEPHLKAFLNAHGDRRRVVPSDDAGLDLDLDRPEDYEQAKKHFLAGH